MSAFDSLRRFLRPNDATVALPADPFIAIDRQRAIENLRLDERAQLNGGKNRPAADSEQFDNVELEIVAEMTEHARRAQINASENHRVYAERLSELALLRELSTISAASQSALGDYRATIIKRRGRLELAKDAIGESYRELAAFKAQNALNRPAHEGILPAYAWSTFAVTWTIESVANTLFLRINDPLGFLGGFIAASVIAATNVGVSAFVGRQVWPFLGHKDLSKRILAWPIGIAWFFGLLAWNFLAAHFRDAKASGLTNPEQTALKLFVNTPFQLDSIYSYGLLIAGILFAIVAAIAAYRMDDPYPGFGAINRRHLERCNTYSDEIEATFEELEATRDDATESANEIREQLQLQFRERGQILAARDSHRNRYREHQNYLETIAAAFLAYYRSANVQSRSDGRSPLGFQRMWHLTRNELPVDTNEPSIDAEVTRAEQGLRRSIDTINAAYVDAIESFDHLDKLKRSLQNG